MDLAHQKAFVFLSSAFIFLGIFLCQLENVCAADNLQFARVSAVTDYHCADGCIEGSLKEGIPVTILNSKGTQTCEGKTGASFSPSYPADSDQSGSTDVTPFTKLRDCGFKIEMFDLVILGQKVSHYQPLVLERVTDRTEIEKANQSIRKAKVIDEFLNAKYGAEPSKQGGYTVDQLTKHMPVVFRYKNVPEFLLLEYSIDRLQPSGPTFGLWKEKTFPITDICRGATNAFQLNGINYLARQVLDRIPFEEAKGRIQLVLDRSKSKQEIEDFDQYITRQLQARIDPKIPLNINHRLSHEVPGLQVADLFVWGIFRKYERKDLLWYDEFKSRVKFDELYLK